MKWIQAENKMFIKEEVIALVFKPANEPNGADLSIHLRGGTTLKVSHDDAERIWKMFNRESKPKTALGF